MSKRTGFNMYLALAAGFFVLTCVTIQVPYGSLFLLAGFICVLMDYRRHRP